MAFKWFKKYFRNVGPGVITGAANDDPSSIATYVQAGAQFGFGTLWLTLYMLPFQVAIQEACARIGAVTGKGIGAVLRDHGRKKTLYSAVVLVLIANIINIGADIGAMAAAAQLIFPVSAIVLTIIFTFIILMLEVFSSYEYYANTLKLLCVSLFAYPATVFLIKAPWLTVLKTTFIPHLEFNFNFLYMVIALLGTTITPYLFFWQASEEVEEKQAMRALNKGFRINKEYMTKMRIDNFIGMFFSEFCAWAIIVVAATILFSHGITNIGSAADAAKALEPLVNTFPNAGVLAKIIFCGGVIGLGLLAVPVLAASASYVFGEAMHWKVGLNLRFSQAKGFYSVMVISTLVGVLFNLFHFNPIKALIYSAVINGLVAVPLVFMIVMIAKDEKIMGHHKSGFWSNVLVWITFASMGLAAIALFFSFVMS